MTDEKTLDELPTPEYEGTVHPNDLHTWQVLLG